MLFSFIDDVDWADLFFDLTYVAAAFQMGTNLKSDVSFRGFTYFLVIALCMLDSWKFKTLHDSTYEATDMVHKVVDVFYIAAIAFAAIFIQPLKDMEDLNTGYALGLSLSLGVGTVVLGIEKIEIMYFSKNIKARKQARQNLFLEVAPRCICFIAAAVVAGLGRENGLMGGDDDRVYGSFFFVFLLLFGSHALGTLLPLLGYMCYILPANAIPWHFQVLNALF